MGKDEKDPFADRRKYRRLDARVSVGYGVTTHSEIPQAIQYQEGLSNNLSKGGIAFRASERINAGTLLRLIIEVPTSGKKVDTVVEVVWNKFEDEFQTYEIGAKFLKIKEEEWNHIETYLLEGEKIEDKAPSISQMQAQVLDLCENFKDLKGKLVCRKCRTSLPSNFQALISANWINPATGSLLCRKCLEKYIYEHVRVEPEHRR